MIDKKLTQLPLTIFGNWHYRSKNESSNLK